MHNASAQPCTHTACARAVGITETGPAHAHTAFTCCQHAFGPHRPAQLLIAWTPATVLLSRPCGTPCLSLALLVHKLATQRPATPHKQLATHPPCPSHTRPLTHSHRLSLTPPMHKGQKTCKARRQRHEALSHKKPSEPLLKNCGSGSGAQALKGDDATRVASLRAPRPAH